MNQPQPDSRQLRQTLGRYPTGVAVVTTERHGKLLGMTINSFASVSLAPPLISWCIGNHARSFAAFRDCSRFTITVLNARQAELARRFATSGGDKFGALASAVRRLNGRIPGGCAWFQCHRYQRFDLGDHSMLIGRVIAYDSTDQPPLLFSNGAFQSACGSLDAVA